MKKVIALKAPGNTGKSETIKKVPELLLAKHPNAEIEHDHTTRVDVRMVLNIDGFRVGIESQGDPSSRLIKESLDLFVKVGCEVIVCATRTSGGTVKAVNALKGYEVLWLDQQRVQSGQSEQESSNLAMAKRIVDEIESAIGEPPTRSRAAGH